MDATSFPKGKSSLGEKSSNKIQLSFDVGHSSIGWAVTTHRIKTGDPEIRGCGVVTFQADDCMASARRGYRRQRRHIRSTRQRIERMKVLLEHLGVLTRKQLDTAGCAWPWQLAASVLKAGKLLNWRDLWDVLRWYAHNRGYDGNRRWSAAEAEAAREDTEKEENARSLMQKHGLSTMAETFCAAVGVDPLGRKRASMVRFKGLNVAFPRAVVEGELRRILQTHIGKLLRVDETLIRALVGNDQNDADAWRSIPCEKLKLPKRYQGALLFGQLVPRFDNRIISTCPISGEKAPSRNCVEFLRFRWALILANVQVTRFGERNSTPLKAAERLELDKRMREAGAMTVEEFKKYVRDVASAISDNMDAMFMDPNAKEALTLDPVQKLIKSELPTIWPLLPESLQKRARGQLRRGKRISLKALRAAMTDMDVSAFDLSVRQVCVGQKRGKSGGLSLEDLMGRELSVKRFDGRAAFSRPLLQKAYEEVLQGRHPKEADGCLFLSEEIRKAQEQRAITEQTNNHLVRHRLLILGRLVDDIIKDYAGGEKGRISRAVIEVNRDLREMSGLTAKEKAQELGLRLANHKHVSARLEEDAAVAKVLDARKARITAGLIRKARVADDLGWTCPYTGQKFEPVDLLTCRVDKDHVVPRADRASDSLDSLVITFSAINKWKGKRTALQFVTEEQGKPVPGLPQLSIMSLTRYRDSISKLDCRKGHDDDQRRKKKRRDLLLVEKYAEKQFVPRDLTVTSQLVRLGAGVIRKRFADMPQPPTVISLPGALTGAVRKAWGVLGCLSMAAPRVVDEDGRVRTKQEIRDITHLHHALDACVLGLAAFYIPNDGRTWELMVKRWGPSEVKELDRLGLLRHSSEGPRLIDLPASVKEELRRRLAEKRVVQHVPRKMEGLRVEQNAWRMVTVDNGIATLQQRVRQPDGARKLNVAREKLSKLLGSQPGKLARLKGALVIPDNFGVAILEPEPVVIPFHKVWVRLNDLRNAHGGKPVKVLRNGQLIRVTGGKNFKGVWRVFSAKNNATGLALDLGEPDVVRLQNKTPGHKINVRLATLIKDGMEVLNCSLTGVAACPTTSSV